MEILTATINSRNLIAFVLTLLSRRVSNYSAVDMKFYSRKWIIINYLFHRKELTRFCNQFENNNKRYRRLNCLAIIHIQ